MTQCKTSKYKNTRRKHTGKPAGFGNGFLHMTPKAQVT